MAGLLLVSPFSLILLQNSSDALFTALSCFALASVLEYLNSSQLRNLLAASLFTGLAALARNDGLLLFVSFLAIALLSGLRPGKRWQTLLGAILPFLLTTCGYLALVSVVSPSAAGFHTVERSYQAFEQGQWVVSSGTWQEATNQARLDYGTPEENQYSILRAI